MVVRFRASRSILGLIALCVVIGTLVLGASLSGEAHAGLDRSEPAPDSTVSVLATQIALYFTQELDASGLIIAVLGPDGERIDLQDAGVDHCDASRKRTTVSLPQELTDGEYIVQWQTLSAEDGETDSGSFSFFLEASTASPVASSAASPVGSPEASPAASPIAC